MGKKAKNGGVRREGGGRRGAGQRKHGLSRWATIWMDENFDYWSDRQAIESIQAGNDEDELEEAIEELEEYLQKWEDIAGMMGGTVFLDYCESLAWGLIEKCYEKIQRFEVQLAILEAANAIF